MDSAASTAMTTPVASTASGARKDSTGREKETAVYPATVIPKVAGEEGKGEGREAVREGGRLGWREKATGQERRVQLLEQLGI